MTVGQLKKLLNKRSDMDDLEVIVEVDNGVRDLRFNIHNVTSVLVPFGGFVSIECRNEDEEEDADACERDSLGNDWW